MLVAKLLSKIFKDDGVILIDYDGQKYICGEPKNKNPIIRVHNWQGIRH